MSLAQTYSLVPFCSRLITSNSGHITQPPGFITKAGTIYLRKMLRWLIRNVGRIFSYVFRRCGANIFLLREKVGWVCVAQSKQQDAWANLWFSFPSHSARIAMPSSCWYNRSKGQNRYGDWIIPCKLEMVLPSKQLDTLIEKYGRMLTWLLWTEV